MSKTVSSWKKVAGVAVATAALSLGVLSSAAQATNPGANGQIVFTEAPNPSTLIDAKIGRINPDGTGVDYLVPRQGEAFDSGRLSQDGSRLVLWGRYGTRTAILERVGSGQVEIVAVSNAGHVVAEPTLRSNGDVLFTARNGAGDMHVVAARQDGTFEEVIPADAHSIEHLAISPDPSTPLLAFVSDREVPPHERAAGNRKAIYTVDLSGAQPYPVRRITADGPDAHLDGLPSWSPDGRRLAFSRRNPGRPRTLHIIDRDGANEIDVTPAGYEVDNPVWSPDGTRLAVAYWDAANNRIGLATMALDGTDFTPVQVPTGANVVPTDWEALPVPPSAGPASNGPGAPANGTAPVGPTAPVTSTPAPGPVPSSAATAPVVGPVPSGAAPVTPGAPVSHTAGSGLLRPPSGGFSPSAGGPTSPQASTPGSSTSPGTNPASRANPVNPSSGTANPLVAPVRAPRIGLLKLAAKKIRFGQKAVRLTSKLDQAGTLEIVIKRRGSTTVVAKQTVKVKKGANAITVALGGKLKGKTRALAVGKYVAVVVAKNAQGKTSKPMKLIFEVAKR